MFNTIININLNINSHNSQQQLQELETLLKKLPKHYGTNSKTKS